MTNPIPEINVTSEIIKIKNENPLIRDVNCLIGCFEDYETINEPVFCTTLTEAEAIFGDDTQYDGNAALKQIFRDNDISGCLIVNCTSVTGSGDNININRNLTQTKIEAAFDLIEFIDFDLLFVAMELTDSIIESIDEFRSKRFKAKRPFGWVGVGTRNNESSYETTSGKLGDGCRAFLTQPLGVKGEELSLLESGAYIAYIISTLPVGNSLTAKELPDVTSLGTSYTFATADDGTPIDLGAKLVGWGFFVVRLIDALNNTYEVVNSANPNGLDLYIGRVIDYIVNDFALRQFLGDKNLKVTHDLIKMECNSLYSKFCKRLELVETIQYTVEKLDAKTVNVKLVELVFADVITKINLSINIKVE